MMGFDHSLPIERYQNSKSKDTVLSTDCMEAWNSPSGVFHCDGFVSNFGHCTVLLNLFIVYFKMASKYALNQQVMVIFLFII